MSILCATDFEEGALQAAEIAAGMAARLDERLVLVHALPVPVTTYVWGEPVTVDPAWLTPWRAELEAKADVLLGGEARRLEALSGAVVQPRVVIGRAVEGVLETAEDVGARLIVLGSGRRSRWGRLLVGSTADRISRLARRPLLLTRVEAAGLRRFALGKERLKIVAGVALEESFGYLAELIQLFQAVGRCEVRWVHVLDRSDLRARVTRGDLAARISRSIAQAAEAYSVGEGGVEVGEQGNVAETLEEIARREHAGLLLAGTHARKPVERMLLGSTALALLHSAECPVAMAPCV